MSIRTVSAVIFGAFAAHRRLRTSLINRTRDQHLNVVVHSVVRGSDGVWPMWIWITHHITKRLPIFAFTKSISLSVSQSVARLLIRIIKSIVRFTVFTGTNLRSILESVNFFQ